MENVLFAEKRSYGSHIRGAAGGFEEGCVYSRSRGGRMGPAVAREGCAIDLKKKAGRLGRRPRRDDDGCGHRRAGGRRIPRSFSKRLRASDRPATADELKALHEFRGET